MDRGHLRLYPFDPDSGLLPEIAAPGALLSGAGGGVVTLLVATDVSRSAWSESAAVALARAWSDQGHRVVLFDLSLTDPVLHETLGLPNSVGIVDLVLRGASIGSVAQQVGPAGFQFVSVGTPVEDAAEVTSSEGWSAFVDAVGSAQAKVLFYVPAHLPGVEGLVARSAATLLLAGDPAQAEWVARSFALDDVVGLVEDREGEGAPGLTPSAVPHRFVADQGGVPPAPADAAGERSEAGPVIGGPDPERAPFPWRAALVGTVVGLGALFAWQVLFGPSGPGPAAGIAGAQPDLSMERSGPPAAPHQAYSLALAAYTTGEVAARQAERVGQRRPDLLFIVTPVRVSGRVYHRLLAGPSEDSLGAERLRVSLAETLIGNDGGNWIIRPTPLAYGLGDFESSETAESRAEEVRIQDVPAYVLEVGVPGSPLFRVYAGAYQSSAEAEVMETTLKAVLGSAPPLEPRVGRRVP